MSKSRFYLLSLNVEIIPGSSILDAVQEAKSLSEKLSARIKFDFNGLSCSVTENTDLSKAQEKYDLAIRDNSKIITFH